MNTPSRREPSSQPALWRAALTGAVLLTFGLAILLAVDHDMARLTRIFDITELAVNLVTVLCMALAARSVWPESRRGAAAWGLIALGYLAYACGDTLAVVFGLTLAVSPNSLALNAAYLSFYPLFLLGVLGLPRVPLKRTEGVKLVLDMALVTFAAGLAISIVFVRPAVLSGSSEHLSLILAAAYPVADLALLWALLSLALDRRETGSRPVYQLLALSAGLLIITDVLYSYRLMAHDAPLGILASFGFSASHLLAALAAVRKATLPRPAAPAAAEVPPEAHPSSRSFYFAYVCLALALVFLILSHLEDITPVTAFIVGVMFLLVLARQVVGLRESGRLYAALREAKDGLEVRVSERTAELTSALEALKDEVSERQKAESAAEASEARFKALVQNANDLLTIHDTTGRILFETPSVGRVLGYGPGGLTGQHFFELVHPEDQEVVLRDFGEVVDRSNPGTPTAFRVKHADGRWRFFESVGSNLLEHPAVRGLVITSRDVTERIEAEQDLRRKVRELTVLNAVGTIASGSQDEESLVAAATAVIRDNLFPDNCGVLLMDEESGLLRHSPSYHIRDRRTPTPDIPLGRGVTGDVALTGSARRVGDVRSDGGYIALDPSMHSEICVPMKLGGKVIGVIDAESRDSDAFTEEDEQILETLASQLATAIGRLRAAAAVAEREERFRRLSEAAFEGICLSEAGIILDVNVRLAEMFGYALGELVGSPYIDLVAPESRAACRANFESGSEAIHEYLALRKDGSTLVVETQARTMPVEGRLVRVTAVRDVTERRQAQVRIERQVRRLAALRHIDSAITNSMDMRVTLDVFLEKAQGELGVDAAAVLLLKHPAKELEYAGGIGFRTQALRHTKIPLGEGAAGKAALERSVVRMDDLQRNPGSFARAPLLLLEGFQTYFAVPFIAKGQVKGVLEIFHRGNLDPDQEWMDFLETLAGQVAIAIDNMSLLEDLHRSNVELALAYDTTLEGWSKALELRDRETQGHTMRVADHAVRLARAAGIAEREIIHVRRGSLLHDIGKMGIPDSILLKPGPLNQEEWAIMRKHTEYAYHLLSPIDFLRPVMDIPYCHHEWWDGTGYPRGLKGEEIPLAARVFAVVDAWDALSHERPYREAWPPERVAEHLREESGTHFDPRIVALFLDMLAEDGKRRR